MKTRGAALKSIANELFDLCIIGAGATGSGCALDAQLRGLKTVLLDAGDFAGATSSMSTKIVHGGVRYLEQAVKELDPAEYHVVDRALHEREHMLKNAPHLARPLEFLVPCFHWPDVAYLDFGLKLYDWIAGKASISPSQFISREETLRRMPTLQSEHLVGSVIYSDGVFDDARYNVTLVKSFSQERGQALNYARVTSFDKTDAGKICAANVEDSLTRERFVVRARAFVNATGPFSDTLRELAHPGTPSRMRLSKGVHILLPLEVLASQDAMLIPKTEDGRVLFAVPWMGRLLAGTTEQEVEVGDELYVTAKEIEYILRHLNRYLARPITPDQVVSAIAGARPLVGSADSRETKKLVRDDVLEVDSESGLISIMGGKWTTHRAMAEDTINAVQKQLGGSVTPSPTRDHALIGATGFTDDYWQKLAGEHGISELTARHLAAKYGTTAPEVIQLIREDDSLREPLCNGLAPIRAEVVFAARDEMALTIEDVLARRIGLQLYSWKASMSVAPVVARLLAKELGRDAGREQEEIEKYVNKINRWLRLAALTTEPDLVEDYQTQMPN
jgi:glycerol-3-phosphate dehydrogenase